MSSDAPRSVEEKMSGVYRAYYAERGDDRNDSLANPQVLFQQLAGDAALVRSLRPLSREREKLRVLDVGCGNGNLLLTLVALGFRPSQLTGIDVIPARIETARERLPGARMILGDASEMEFDSGSFDLVLESTIFLQMTDDRLAHAIAAEMIRVLAPGGSLIIRDWRIGNPRDPTHSPLNRRRLGSLFQVGKRTAIVSRESGALVPPLGRFLSQHAPWAYFLVQACLPFFVGLVVTRLQRIEALETKYA